MKKLKIFISYPPLSGKGSPMLTQNRQFQWYHEPSYIFPLVPASAATILKNEGHNVFWDDCITRNIDYSTFLLNFKNKKPDIIVIETKTPVVKMHWKIIDELKSIHQETSVILMGDHVTALPKESMKNSKADFIITGGDYDFLLLNIVNFLTKEEELDKGIWYRDKGSIKNTGAFELSGDLNSLPFIDRDLTMAHLYGEKWKKRTPFFYTQAGRDCPWAKCTFCSWTTTFPKFRTRSPESLLNEIDYLIKEYDVKEIFDDTGTLPGGKWLIEFCEGMIERGFNKKILFSCNMRFDYITPKTAKLMKEAGFRKIKSGLESASQETLNQVEKGIQVKDIVDGCKNASKAGIDVHLTVMVGYPWEKRKDAINSINLAKMLLGKGFAEMLQATVVMPYPGTPLHKFCIENNHFNIDPKDYEKYDMSNPVIKTPDMTNEEIMSMCRGLYKSFLTPSYILRRISRIRSVEDLDYIYRGGKALIGHLKDFFR